VQEGSLGIDSLAYKIEKLFHAVYVPDFIHTFDFE